MQFKYPFIFTILLAPLFNNLSGQANLEVEGAVIIGHSTEEYPESGTIRWNGLDFQLWNGATWLSLTQGAPLTDYDGNVYKTVKIGSQVWMAENLRTTKFNHGSPIPQVSDNLSWSAHNEAAWCWYDNNMSHESTYGKLYNWYVVNDSTRICPTGWRLPTNDDLDILVELLGGEDEAGGPLKSTGFSLWNEPNTGATNVSRFSGHPGGVRYANGSFVLKNQFGFWWTSDEATTSDARFYSLVWNDTNVNRNAFDKNYGQSIRCIKN